jgi:hypothetical protein
VTAEIAAGAELVAGTGTAPADLAIIDDADPERQFFVVAGYYCTSGGLLLEQSGPELQVKVTDEVDRDAPQPVSSVFRLDRADFDGTFTVLGDSASERIDVEDWVVAEPG